MSELNIRKMRLALEQIANDPANAVTYFEDKWREIAKQALQPNTPVCRAETQPQPKHLTPQRR